MQAILDTCSSGTVIHLKAGATYNQYNGLIVTVPVTIISNNATLKRMPMTEVLTTTSTATTDTSLTVASIPSDWKVGDYVHAYKDTTGIDVMYGGRQIKRIVGNRIDFYFPVMYVVYGSLPNLPIGTKVRRVFNQIGTAHDTAKLEGEYIGYKIPFKLTT